MDAVDEFIDSFNRGEVPPLDRLASPEYSFAEPLYPGPYDAAGHVELMAQVLTRFPDRRIDVRRRVPGASSVLVEGAWSGTPSDGGDRLVLEAMVVFDLDDSGRLRRMRTFYDTPSI